MRRGRKGQTRREEELCRDRRGDKRIDEQTGKAEQVGGKLFYTHAGVSLQRRQSSRSPGCICLPDLSVRARGPLSRDGQGDGRDGRGTAHEKKRRGGGQKREREAGEEKKTVKTEKNETEEGKRK